MASVVAVPARLREAEPASARPSASEALASYLEAISFIERLHRLMLDVIKDEFERLGDDGVNSVQALLLFNIGDDELTAGELKSRGYYQGSNVSYNLKKLVEGGYIHHERSMADRRAVRIRLTEKGEAVRSRLAALFAGHAERFGGGSDVTPEAMRRMTDAMRRLERFWGQQIRYIY